MIKALCEPMIEKVSLVAIFFLLHHLSLSQDQSLADSLINVLETSTSLQQEERLSLLSDITNHTTNPNAKISYAEKLIIEAKAQQDAGYLILGYKHLGKGYKLNGNLDMAIEVYYKSAAVADSLGDEVAEGDALANIATVYNTNGEFQKAKDLSNRAITRYLTARDTARLAVQYLNLGNTLYYLEQYDSARYFLALAHQLNQHKYAGIYIDGTLSLVLAKIGRIDSAQALLTGAIDRWEEYEDYYAISDCVIQFGGTLFDRGRSDDAIRYVELGYEIARTNGLKEQIQDGAKILASFYRNLNDFQKAFDYQQKYYAYRDSLINAESIRKIADQRTEYEVGLKQAEVDLLEAQRETQRLLLLGLGAFLLVVLIFAVVIYRFYALKNSLSKELASQKEELERLNTTKDKFFSIISHDLRSPVSAFLGISRMIKVLVKTKQTDELLDMTVEIDKSVDRLSSLLDNLLNWAMHQQGHFPNVPEKLNLHEMITDLMDTFSTMAAGKQIEMVQETDPSIELWADKNSTTTIFRNLINNALKFTPEGGQVRITATQSKNQCEVTVEDNGLGIPQDKLDELFTFTDKKSSYGTKGEKGLGLGLQLVHEFVKMNRGEIEVTSQVGSGTTFKISMPLYSEHSVASQPM